MMIAMDVARDLLDHYELILIIFRLENYKKEYNLLGI